jgi:L-rhamnose isomerase
VVTEQISLPHEQEIRQEMQTSTISKISLVKHNQVKALALELMADRFTFNGQPKFTRVSPTFVDSLERFVYAALVTAIRRHPSIGKVIKDF